MFQEYSTNYETSQKDMNIVWGWYYDLGAADAVLTVVVYPLFEIRLL